MKKPWLAVGALALVAVAAVAWWVRSRSAPAVETLAVRVEEVAELVRGPGVVDARILASVGTRITGTVTEVFVDVGDRVEATAPLARLDDSQLRVRLAAAGAAAEAAEHSLAFAEAEIDRATAALDLARRTAFRQVALAREGVAAESAADEAEAAHASAAAALESSRAALRSRRAELARARQELAAAEIEADYATILAPFAGIVTSRRVSPGDAVLPGAALVELLDPGSVWVAAWVDESLVGRVAVGQPARLRLRSGWQGPGKVVRIARRADPVARELEVDVAFVPDLDRLTLDEEAEVSIEVGRVTGLAVPASALVGTGDERGVFVVRDGRALLVPIRVGARGEERVTIEGGLVAGEPVVRNPRGLAPGARVRAAPTEP